MSSSHIRGVLIGAGGQLASDLQPLLGSAVRGLAHRDVQIEIRDSLEQALEDIHQGFVINTAGYNLVDAAEDDPERAFAVNAFGPRNLAKLCAARGLTLVHISSDYVLDGGPGASSPLTESALPSPGGVYAASKLAGEHFVRAECPDHLIIRTCGLFGVVATRAKGNFIETMLRLAQTRQDLNVIDDQRCTPSFTADVAAAIVDLINCQARGTFHVTNAGQTTWKQLAEYVFQRQGLATRVRAITTAEFGARARRPAWSVLDCTRLETTLNRRMPTWQDAVTRYLAARLQSSRDARNPQEP